jgi:hypothetical protein
MEITPGMRPTIGRQLEKAVNPMRKRKIENLLREALLRGGKMELALYEYELEEHIEYWYEGLKADRDEFVFVVTENSGDVAMALITKEKTVFINEDARKKLLEFWPRTYNANMKKLIPMMARDLANDIVSVNGVKTVSGT